jgi:hypothetical protein
MNDKLKTASAESLKKYFWWLIPLTFIFIFSVIFLFGYKAFNALTGGGSPNSITSVETIYSSILIFLAGLLRLALIDFKFSEFLKFKKGILAILVIVILALIYYF